MVSLLIVEALVELSILVVGEGRCSRIVFYLLQLRINLPIYAFKIGKKMRSLIIFLSLSELLVRNIDIGLTILSFLPICFGLSMLEHLSLDVMN